MMRVLCAALLVWVGCTEDPQPVRAIPTLSAPAERPHRSPELRIGVGAMLSPMATFESYDDLLRGIAQRLGRPYQMVQRRTYQELNDLIVDGEVELAFICSGAWVSLPSDAAEILVVPELAGKTAYHGLIVTRQDATFESFADLEHTRFAYTDPLSNTGHFYPVNLIIALGKKPAAFFSSTIFSGSHDRSLWAVQRGIVDAAAVFDVGYSLMKGAKHEVRVLERSTAMAPPPVVAPLSIPKDVRDTMRTYLLEIADQPDGSAKLDALGIDRFRLPATVDYGPIRRMMETATGADP